MPPARRVRARSSPIGLLAQACRLGLSGPPHLRFVNGQGLTWISAQVSLQKGLGLGKYEGQCAALTAETNRKGVKP